jgi:hypothetical protein
MKKLFKLFFFGGIFMLMLCSCNAGRGNVRVDAEILQSLPDTLRQDALYRMISSVEMYNGRAFDFWMPLMQRSDDIIMAVVLSLIFSLSIIIIIYMLLKARNRKLRTELEITEKLLDRIERLHEKNINISEAKSLIPYTFKEKKSSYMYDVTILAVGLGITIMANVMRVDFFIGVGLLIAIIGALRCVVHIITDYNNRKK